MFYFIRQRERSSPRANGFSSWQADAQFK